MALLPNVNSTMSKLHFNFRLPRYWTIAKRGERLNRIYETTPLNYHYDAANTVVKEWLMDMNIYPNTSKNFDACDPVRYVSRWFIFVVIYVLPNHNLYLLICTPLNPKTNHLVMYCNTQHMYINTH